MEHLRNIIGEIFVIVHDHANDIMNGEFHDELSCNGCLVCQLKGAAVDGVGVKAASLAVLKTHSESAEFRERIPKGLIQKLSLYAKEE